MVSLEDILRDAGVDFRPPGEHHHVRHGWLGVDCPDCGSFGKYRLGLHAGRRKASCWSCGRRDFARTLAELTGAGWPKVKEWLGELGDGEPEPEVVARGELVLPDGLGPLLRAHRNYLRGRRLDPDALERLWGVRGTGPAVDLPWRLWVPYALDGKVLSWTTRGVRPGDGRYINARPDQEAVAKSQLLGGEDLARHAVVVVEGPLDAFALGPGAVWTGGVGFSPAQVRRIARYPVVAVCYDADPTGEGRRAARRLCAELLASCRKVTNVVLESGKDPAEASDNERAQIRRHFLE